MNFDTCDVIAYIDGACKGNPGPGGWGVRVEFSKGSVELWGGELDTTNNKMELTAALKALERCLFFNSILIVTDSKYVYEGITNWVKRWENAGWKGLNKKPVKNVDLWKDLNRLNKVCKVKWQWVHGHADCPGNNRADILANRGINDLRA